jgi:hypothetical protein
VPAEAGLPSLCHHTLQSYGRLSRLRKAERALVERRRRLLQRAAALAKDPLMPLKVTATERRILREPGLLEDYQARLHRSRQGFLASLQGRTRLENVSYEKQRGGCSWRRCLPDQSPVMAGLLQVGQQEPATAA